MAGRTFDWKEETCSSVARCGTSARCSPAGLYSRIGRTLPCVSAASGDPYPADGADGSSDEVALLFLRIVRAPGGKWSDQLWTMLMTRSASPGVSLIRTSSAFLFLETR